MPVLGGYLSAEHFQNWILYSASLYKLFRDEIPRLKLARIKKDLEFVKEIGELYDMQFLTHIICILLDISLKLGKGLIRYGLNRPESWYSGLGHFGASSNTKLILSKSE